MEVCEDKWWHRSATLEHLRMCAQDAKISSAQANTWRCKLGGGHFTVYIFQLQDCLFVNSCIHY